MILPAYPAYCVYNIHARCQTLENKPSHANISMYPWNKIEHQESAVSSASPSSKSFQRTSGSRIGSSCAASHILCKVRVRIESMRQSWFILISDAYAVQRQNGKQNGSGLISGLVMISLNSSWSWARLSNMSSTQRFAWWSSWISLSISRLWEILVDVWCILMHVDAFCAFWCILAHLWNTRAFPLHVYLVSPSVQASRTPSPDSSAAAKRVRIFFVCSIRSLSWRKGQHVTLRRYRAMLAMPSIAWGPEPSVASWACHPMLRPWRFLA